LHGQWPFVAIWDRKPFGLFLVYAIIRLFGGTGIVQYQIAATGCALATAWIIARILRRDVSAPGAWAAGVVYLLYCCLTGGDGGQSPIFYNLPVAAAALLIRGIADAPGEFGAACRRRAALAMLLIGVAMQIKYSVVFEGVFFGLYLIVRAHRGGMRPPAIAAHASLWCALALVPTGAVALLYWRLGAWHDFVFANFESIFLRPGERADLPARLWKIAVRVAPLVAAALWSWKADRDASAGRRFVLMWGAAAVAGFLVFGTYSDHYALPLFVPLAVASAPILDGIADPQRRRARAAAAIAILLIGAIGGGSTIAHNRRSRGTGGGVAALAQRIGDRPSGCLFVFSGDPILYHVTRSCLPTRYIFPTFLTERRDTPTLGVDYRAELARVIAGRPRFIVSRATVPKEAEPETWRMMQAALDQHYRLVLTARDGRAVALLYERKDG
jgi:hypothetical protein